ncbi:MAG: SpoIIIAC/SpoIIIAD family protein [Cellulosilyticaceae bacterium]
MIDFMILMKVAGVGIMAFFICKVLKEVGRDTESAMVSLIALIIVLGIAGTYIYDLFKTVETLFMF